MDYDKGPSVIPIYSSLICSILAFFFSIIAFFSPYWLVSIPKYNNNFIRLGLWVACFDGFTFPEDYISKKYDGCWFIWYPEFKYIHFWINPSWFFAVQLLSLIALICNIYGFLTLLLKFVRVMKKIHFSSDRAIIVTQLVAAMCYIIISIIMGVMSKDRQWMPRYDHNQLSWGFAFEVLAGFFTIFTFISHCCHFLVSHCVNGPNWKKQRHGDDSALDIEQKRPLTSSSRVTSAAAVSAKNREVVESEMGGSRHTLTTRPLLPPGSGYTSGTLRSAGAQSVLSDSTV